MVPPNLLATYYFPCLKTVEVARLWAGFTCHKGIPRIDRVGLSGWLPLFIKHDALQHGANGTARKALLGSSEKLTNNAGFSCAGVTEQINDWQIARHPYQCV